MTIPRLDPDAADLDVAITIPGKLTPYFQQWYKATKEPGETPEEFTYRLLKITAHTWYVNRYGPVESEALEEVEKAAVLVANAQRTVGINALQLDIAALLAELS